MKAMSENFSGHRGSLPPQLFKYIDISNIALETACFIKYMQEAATEYLNNQGDFIYNDEFLEDEGIYHIRPKLFGQDVYVDYIKSGNFGAVHRMQIGDSVFAFKVNFVENTIGDLRGMSEYKRARNLINRPYIGATFKCCRKKYSWILCDYVEHDYEESFENAEEKLFYAHLTKGLRYDDMAVANIKNGRIIDLDRLKHSVPDLSRAEIDMVKKFAHSMRMNDVAAVRRLAEQALIKYPNVILYMAKQMRKAPARLQKFRSIIAEYRARMIKQKCMASQLQNVH